MKKNPFETTVTYEITQNVHGNPHSHHVNPQGNPHEIHRKAATSERRLLLAMPQPLPLRDDPEGLGRTGGPRDPRGRWFIPLLVGGNWLVAMDFE